MRTAILSDVYRTRTYIYELGSVLRHINSHSELVTQRGVVGVLLTRNSVRVAANWSFSAGGRFETHLRTIGDKLEVRRFHRKDGAVGRANTPSITDLVHLNQCHCFAIQFRAYSQPAQIHACVRVERHRRRAERSGGRLRVQRADTEHVHRRAHWSFSVQRWANFTRRISRFVGFVTFRCLHKNIEDYVTITAISVNNPTPSCIAATCRTIAFCAATWRTCEVT